jgi:hypothetical protein
MDLESIKRFIKPTSSGRVTDPALALQGVAIFTKMQYVGKRLM